MCGVYRLCSAGAVSADGIYTIHCTYTTLIDIDLCCYNAGLRLCDNLFMMNGTNKRFISVLISNFTILDFKQGLAKIPC